MCWGAAPVSTGVTGKQIPAYAGMTAGCLTKQMRRAAGFARRPTPFLFYGGTVIPLSEAKAGSHGYYVPYRHPAERSESGISWMLCAVKSSR